MKGIIVLSSYSFPSNMEYIKESNVQIRSILTQRLSLLGISAEDMLDKEAVSKYKIGKHQAETEEVIHQLYSAMGITLVEVSWRRDTCTIQTPVADPDYTQTLLAIQYIPQKPKDDDDQLLSEM